MRGAFQKRRTRSISSGAKSMCAASWLARPPTSRPPIALGWPVSENGPMPGWPMRPVARWQLMMALTLSVPCADWFTPCEKQVTALLVGAEQLEEARDVGFVEAGRSARLRQRRARSRARARARRRSPSCARRYSAGRARRSSARCTSRPENSAVSVPGAIARNRSASSPVAVRRGSITTILAPRSRRLRDHALEQHRMAPGGVRADQHEQVGLVEVLVAARHHVRAEGAAVAGDRSTPCRAANWCRHWPSR